MSEINTAVVTRALALGSARTGVLMSSFDDMHAAIEEVMERPVWTSEMGDKVIAAEIREKAAKPFTEAIGALLTAIEEAEAPA